MTIPVPLTVRLQSTRTDRYVTAEVRNLTFRETAPGGFASARLSLDRSLNTQPADIDYYTKVFIYDGRNGRTIWEGLIEDPHRTAGTDGQVWELAVVGPAGRVEDRAIPYIIIDQDLQSFKRVDTNNIAGGSLTVTQDPLDAAGPQGLKFHFPQGLTHDNGSHVAAQYERIWLAGQKLARFDYAWTGGGTDVAYLVFTELYVAGAGTPERPRSQTLSPGGALSSKVVVTDWTNGKDTLRMDLYRSAAPGPVTTPNDGFWCHIHNIFILAMRYTAAGSEITSGYTTNSVLSSDIVSDILGRGLLPLFDSTNATIATTSFAITQFAYPDAVTPGTMLIDLMKLDAAYFWEARATNPATGKYIFNWKLWPTTVRYEADVIDGFDSPGSANDLFNKVRVRYTDVDGQIVTIQRTQSVAVLTAAGFDREKFIDLGDTAGTLANANQVGDQFLADHAVPPNAGTLTVARPILDLQTGRMVMPWEIEAGNLIRVRGVKPSIDVLNATARDGVTVFRIVARDYNATEAVATLELDSYSPTIERALADLTKKQTQRR